jgi:cytidylate kinase
VPHSIEDIVDRQMRRWDYEQRQAPIPKAPCVAISRQRGSGGAELGRRVAERLDYGFFDREIVEQVAREAKVQRGLVAGLDEHVRSTIDRYVMDAFLLRSFKESDYLRRLVHVVATLGERGHAVILGRGATFILPADQALRVRVVAPRALRVERVAERRKLAPEQAAEEVDRKDAQQRAFLTHDFGVDPEDPTLYDLVVNTGTLGVEAAADLVVAALERRFPAARRGAVRA